MFAKARDLTFLKSVIFPVKTPDVVGTEKPVCSPLNPSAVGLWKAPSRDVMSCSDQWPHCGPLLSHTQTLSRASCPDWVLWMEVKECFSLFMCIVKDCVCNSIPSSEKENNQNTDTELYKWGEILKGILTRVEREELATWHVAKRVYQVRTLGEICGFGAARG